VQQLAMYESTLNKQNMGIGNKTRAKLIWQKATSLGS